MSKSTITICLAFISLSSFAQPSILTLNKILVKNILQNVSFIPSKSFVSNSYSGSDSLSSYNSMVSTNQSFYISREEVITAEINPGKQKTSFVVKGGGWNSIPFYLQTGVC